MIGAIIQARMGSTRLPGKVLREVMGKPLLLLMLERVAAAKSIKKVVLAIPDTPENGALERFALRYGFDCFRGSENDVLSRYCKAAEKFGIDPVVRLTSDCPLIDPALIDHAVALWKKGKYDYFTNAIERTYPDGEDIEIISYSALKRAHLEAADAHDREHVTTYVGCREKEFSLGNFAQKENRSSLRWTVDYPEDFEFVRRVFEELYHAKGPGFSMREILRLLREKPEISAINSGVAGKDNLKIAKAKLEESGRA